MSIFFPGYILYQLIGYNTVYGSLYNELSDLLKEPYVASAESFESTGTNLGLLHDQLNDLLIENEGRSLPIKMFKDDYVAEFKADSEHPFNIALRENDTYNFTALAPTRIIYCKADDQVPYRNSVVADSIMNVNEASNTTVIDVNSNADHGGCIFPAVEESLRFIQSFLTSTSTDDQFAHQVDFSVYPNPADSEISIVYPYDVKDQVRLNIYDFNAKLVMSYTMNHRNDDSIDISNLQAGTYVIQIDSNEGIGYRKFIKH